MMAAITAAENGKKVLILEPEKIFGKKLRITGKGRCNVTNNCDIKTFLLNVPTNPKFLYSALSSFDVDSAMSFFEKLGVPLKTERGNRVFPVSDNAHDIANALADRMRALGVKIEKTKAKKLLVDDGKVIGVLTEKGERFSQSVLIATGGLSYPLTGSTGDGYKMAEEVGHTIIPQHGSLVPLESDNDYCYEMQGFSLKNVLLTAYSPDGKKLYSELGEMLFTHFGVSGPLVLSASSHMNTCGAKGCKLLVDLKPGLDEKKLDARILRDFEKYINRDFENSLGDLAGKSMIPVLVRLSGIPGNTKVNSITKEQRKTLVSLFKAFPVDISGRRPVSDAIITSGGICVKEINPRTMESKIVSGLYFAGEIIDVDAYTGGFNLQIAWSTGYLAGKSM